MVSHEHPATRPRSPRDAKRGQMRGWFPGDFRAVRRVGYGRGGVVVMNGVGRTYMSDIHAARGRVAKKQGRIYASPTEPPLPPLDRGVF